VQCIAYQKATSTVYVCNPRAWSFGTADGSDGTFKPLLDFREAKGFYECNGVDMATKCEPQLCIAYCGGGHYAQAPLCCAYDTPSCGPAIAESGMAHCSGSDAGPGVKDAGTHVLPDATAHGKSSSGCTVVPRPSRSGSGGTSALALLAAALLARRRR
jgi:hypothetical protein